MKKTRSATLNFIPVSMSRSSVSPSIFALPMLLRSINANNLWDELA